MSRLFSDRRRGRPLRVFIHGHYNSGNVGDEALLAGLVQALAEALPDVPMEVSFVSRMVALPVHAGMTYRAVPNNLVAELLVARYSSLLIFGGGSQFQDFGSLFRVRFLVKPLLLVLLARRVLGLGLSLGPVSTAPGRAITQATLRRMVAVHVRDAASVSVARTFGVLAHPGEDLALLLGGVPGSNARTSGRRLLLSLVPFAVQGGGEARQQQALLGLEAALQAALSQRPGLLVQGADFEPGSDTPALRQVLSRVSDEPLLTGDVETLRAGYLRSDLVLATRLHSMVFAFLAERPLLVIVYHPKVEAMALQLGYPQNSLLPLSTLHSPVELLAALEAFLDHPERYLPSRTPAQLRVQAEASVRALLRQVVPARGTGASPVFPASECPATNPPGSDAGCTEDEVTEPV